MRGVQTSDAADVFYNLTWVRVAHGLFLGVDGLAVHRDLKLALGATHQGDGFQVVAIFFDYLSRQPDGTWAVGSLLAIYYLHFHVVFPPVWSAHLLKKDLAQPMPGTLRIGVREWCSVRYTHATRLYAPPLSVVQFTPYAIRNT